MTTEQQLPKGWKIERLGDVCSPPQYGFTTKAVENGTIRLLRTTDITNGKINWTDVPFCYENPDNIEKYLLQDGDIVISRAGSVGVSYLINNPPHSVFASYLIRFQPFINKKYFYFFLKSLAYWKQISENSVGIAVPNVNASKLKNILIPVAPQETQQAIVNKIESLFDEIDEGIGRLKTAAQQIQQYRQSLLKNAFNGELSKEWRSKHADTLPSASELLAQIQTAREQHHAQQLADWQTAVSQWEQNGKEGKKPSKPKAPTQAVKFEENSENRNKNSYIRIPIGFFIETPKYGTSKKCEYEKYENSTGVIRIPNITENGLINLEDMKYAEFSTEDKTDYALKKGDLLLIRSNGSVNIVGSVGLVGLEETNYIYAGYLIRFRPIQDIVNSRFLKFAFQSLDVRTQIEFKAKSTSGVNNINAQEVQDLQINVFSLSEQTQIVAILESKLTACDQLAAELAKQLKQAELLKQAVLKAAFSGNLLDK